MTDFTVIELREAADNEDDPYTRELLCWACNTITDYDVAASKLIARVESGRGVGADAYTDAVRCLGREVG